VDHRIVSEEAFVSDDGQPGHAVRCSCGETIRVSLDSEHPVAALRNLAYDQWASHKREMG
jgi:hypothetical protein